VGFTLFSKTKTDRKERSKDTLRGDSVSPRSRSGYPTTQSRPTENLAEARKRQAEMAAKIDAIESEMTAEFPPLTRNTRKSGKPVPAGVDVPDSAKREPETSNISKTSPNSEANLPTFIQDNPATDVLIDETMRMNAVELSESSSSVPPLVEEIAILFANGQIADCSKALRDELERDPSVQVAWLLLFEIYQQTGNLKDFDSLALDYSVKFESSPPAWRDFKRDQNQKKAPVATRADPTEVTLPARMTADSQKELEAFKKLLKPGGSAKLNFEKLSEADEAGSRVLRELLAAAKKSALPITISGATQAAFALRGKLVINVRQPEEGVWLATLDLYHLLGWQRQFEDLAVDYAVTFEVSPPSYDPPPKHIHIAGALNKESGAGGESGPSLAPEAHPELKGDIVGSASDAIATLETAAAALDRIEVDCGQLGRIDFSAAGSLLNWLLSANARGKHFSFTQVNTLAAALFTVVGINGVADVISRRN
jgi:ABC-type transporter Mla MlaB component